MQYYASMQELIGHTPPVALTHLGFPTGVRVFAKLELWNPAGSAKDRVGRAMLDAAEASGRLRPGGTVVEGTAGNTGLGIAFAALNRGYRVIFVVPEKFSSEKQTLMRALGAEIVHTPRAGGMQAAAARAREIAAGIPGAITLEQFRNPANPGAHYRTTGPEIYQALDGRVDYLVSGAGSGGTFTGILRYLKEQNPAVRGVLADPYGSIIGGGEHGEYEIEGIGNRRGPRRRAKARSGRRAREYRRAYHRPRRAVFQQAPARRIGGRTDRRRAGGRGGRMTGRAALAHTEAPQAHLSSLRRFSARQYVRAGMLGNYFGLYSVILMSG